jgi:hypothetical protein
MVGVGCRQSRGTLDGVQQEILLLKSELWARSVTKIIVRSLLRLHSNTNRALLIRHWSPALSANAIRRGLDSLGQNSTNQQRATVRVAR